MTRIDDQLTSQDSAMGSSAGKVKVCCVCGIDLRGKTRLKDSTGTYWCLDCGQADSQRKHPVDCPDCKQAFPRAHMAEFNGVLLCEGCITKRKQALKREQARIAAAEEEERRQANVKKAWIIAGAVVVVIILAGVGLKLWWG